MILIVTNVFNGDIRAVLTISQLLKYRNVYTYANIKITGGFTLFYCEDVALLVFSVVNEPWLSDLFIHCGLSLFGSPKSNQKWNPALVS